MGLPYICQSGLHCAHCEFFISTTQLHLFQCLTRLLCPVSNATCHVNLVVISLVIFTPVFLLEIPPLCSDACIMPWNKAIVKLTWALTSRYSCLYYYWMLTGFLLQILFSYTMKRQDITSLFILTVASLLHNLPSSYPFKTQEGCCVRELYNEFICFQ